MIAPLLLCACSEDHHPAILGRGIYPCVRIGSIEHPKVDLPLGSRDGRCPCLKCGHGRRLRAGGGDCGGDVYLGGRTGAGSAGRLCDPIAVIGDRGHLELSAVPRVGHENKHPISAQVHALQLVEEHFSFIFGRAAFPVRYRPRNVLH